MIGETNTVKTKKELNAIKNDLENLSKKLSELSDEELKDVTGGVKNLNAVTIVTLFTTLLGVDGRSPSTTINPAESISMEKLKVIAEENINTESLDNE